MNTETANNTRPFFSSPSSRPVFRIFAGGSAGFSLFPSSSCRWLWSLPDSGFSALEAAATTHSTLLTVPWSAPVPEAATSTRWSAAPAAASTTTTASFFSTCRRRRQHRIRIGSQRFKGAIIQVSSNSRHILCYPLSLSLFFSEFLVLTLNIFSS